MLATECRQWCSPVGTVFIRLPAHLQRRVILISCLLLHLCFTCWDLYKSPLQRTREIQFATTLTALCMPVVRSGQVLAGDHLTPG